MQVGEEQQIGAQERVFDGDRFLDLHHHFRAPGIAGRGHDLGPDAPVLVIGEAAAITGPRLYQDGMALLNELLHPGGCHGDSVFVVLNLLGDTDYHGKLLDENSWETLLYPHLSAFLKCITH